MISKQIKFISSWTIDLIINNINVHTFNRVVKSRRGIENETFNTLKNQDYSFEYNFGLGNNNLFTNMLMLLLFTFSIDQIQQPTSENFQS